MLVLIQNQIAIDHWLSQWQSIRHNAHIYPRETRTGGSHSLMHHAIPFPDVAEIAAVCIGAQKVDRKRQLPCARQVRLYALLCYEEVVSCQ